MDQPQEKSELVSLSVAIMKFRSKPATSSWNMLFPVTSQGFCMACLFSGKCDKAGSRCAKYINALTTIKAPALIIAPVTFPKFIFYWLA